MIHKVLARNLAVSRGGRRLFADLSFEVSAGDAVSVTGPNGAGKTSLLRVLAGLLKPDAGVVEFHCEGRRLDPEEARAQGLHLAGHLDGLKPSRTGREELRFWAQWAGATPETLRRAQATFALETLLDLDVRVLSAGQRRRLALARLLAPPRPLWLLDEPMAPLDALRRGAFAEIMTHHLAGGGMILAAVHDPLPIPTRTLELDLP